MSASPPDTVEKNQKLMALGKNTLVSIFIFYILIQAITLYRVFLLLFLDKAPTSRGALMFCILMSLIGATVFYSRKLYKACISDTYNFTDGSDNQVIGTFFFFVFRPIFASIFALVSHMIWESTIMSSVSGFTQFSPTHFYVSGVLGFFVGFLAGRVLNKMESSGEKHLKGVW